jgi:hypothetical protein
VLGAHTAMCVRFRASVLFDVSMIDLSE